MNDEKMIRRAREDWQNLPGDNSLEGCLLVLGVIAVVGPLVVFITGSIVSDLTGANQDACTNWSAAVVGAGVFLWALIKIPVFRFLAAILTATAVGMSLSLFLLVLYGGKEILDTCKLGSVVFVSLSSMGAMGLVIFLWPKRWQ